MIGIVGGGISGLLLLHLLIESGRDALVFESADQPGGVMQSRRLEGPRGPVTVDLGPQRMRLTPALLEVLEALDLVDSLQRAPAGIPFTIYHRGKLHPAPLSLHDALRTDLISLGGKVRAAADLVTPAPKAGESVADALTRKLGPEVYRRLAGPLLGGLYGSDPAQMDARHSLVPILRRTGSRRSLIAGLLRAASWERAPVISFREGMGALPSAIARRYADQLRLGEEVRSVSPSPGGGFRIESEGGVWTVEQVVLTLPAPRAAPVVTASAPEAAARLAKLRYNPLAIVPLVTSVDDLSKKTGSGFKMTMDEPAATRGVTAHEALFGRQGLFTAFLGGMGAEAVVDLPSEEIEALATADFERVTGADATPLLVHRTWMPAWDRSWAALDDLTLPRGIHLCAAFSERPGILGRLENARRLLAELEGRPNARVPSN